MISAKARACHCARSCAGGKIRTDRSMPTGSPRRACKGGETINGTRSIPGSFGSACPLGIVFRCMETAPDDCVEGLIHWTETWVSLGLPEDCPHIVQGRHNALSPDAYYTREMCEALKKRMRIGWIRE